ncbi:MAG: TatD family hydrolase [Myxococcaceae bacterium]|nr:TatD family hydrolase [Myxococcaceae bacterium]MCI0671898.1 TatD family hydrolase [Myxococcaceae bacterium]
MSGVPALFDATLHPEGLSEQDLETMRQFGVQAALVVARAVPGPTARTLLSHFDQLAGPQLERLRRAGIRGYAALGVHPRAIPRRGLGEVLSALPDYFRGGKVVALGEVGLTTGDEEQEEALREQLSLARRLKVPVVVGTPQRDKPRVTRRTLTLLQESGLVPGRVMVGHASSTTVRLILACGYVAGLTLHPDALSAERAVALVRRLGSERLVLASGAGLGASDILALPRASHLLVKAHLSERVLARVTTDNVARLLRVPAA